MVTLAGFAARLRAVAHKCLHLTHRLEWRTGGFSNPETGTCTGDIICRTCGRLYWCRWYDRAQPWMAIVMLLFWPFLATGVHASPRAIQSYSECPKGVTAAVEAATGEYPDNWTVVVACKPGEFANLRRAFRAPAAAVAFTTLGSHFTFVDGLRLFSRDGLREDLRHELEHIRCSCSLGEDAIPQTGVKKSANPKISWRGAVMKSIRRVRPTSKAEEPPVGKAKDPTASLLDKAGAVALRDALLEDLHAAEHSLVAAALKLGKFRAGKGWLALGYETMTAWREREMNFSEFYKLAHVAWLLDAGVPAEAVEKMKLSNVDAMVRQLPEKLWLDPEWQLAAQELPVADFAARAEAEGEKIGTAIEAMQSRGFRAPLSLCERWDTALKVAEAVDGAVRMEQRVEAIVACYLDSDSAQPGKSRLQRFHESAENA